VEYFELALLSNKLAETCYRYSDDRHVQLPKEMLKRISKDYFDPSRGTLKLLWKEEWRELGITQVYHPISNVVMIAFNC